MERALHGLQKSQTDPSLVSHRPCTASSSMERAFTVSKSHRPAPPWSPTDRPLLAPPSSGPSTVEILGRNFDGPYLFFKSSYEKPHRRHLFLVFDGLSNKTAFGRLP